MNNELMRDENFIRCSTMVAELLMKYKSKEMELGGESKEDSPPSFFAFLDLKIILSSYVIEKKKMITTDKNTEDDFSILSAVMEGDAIWKTATYILVFNAYSGRWFFSGCSGRRNKGVCQNARNQYHRQVFRRR